MKAVMIEAFGELPKLVNVADPKVEKDGVVVKVEANGICRSDWHGWMGHEVVLVFRPICSLAKVDHGFI